MITVVTGTDVEKLKGEFESVINGMNMVGKIPYDVYSELYDVGTDCIQKAYELGKSELEQDKKGRVVEHFEAYGQCRDSRRIAELEAQIEKMKTELHHRLVSPSHDDSDCLDKIVGLDRLWQFGQEF